MSDHRWNSGTRAWDLHMTITSLPFMKRCAERAERKKERKTDFTAKRLQTVPLEDTEHAKARLAGWKLRRNYSQREAETNKFLAKKTFLTLIVNSLWLSSGNLPFSVGHSRLASFFFGWIFYSFTVSFCSWWVFNWKILSEWSRHDDESSCRMSRNKATTMFHHPHSAAAEM